MKRLHYILLSTFIASATLTATAQQEANQTQRRSPQARTGARETEKKETGLPELTVRAQDMNQRLTQETGNANWMRVIYRQVDLDKEQNAPLYYPPRPVNGNMNLFSKIFQLMIEGKIEAYRYEDGFEAFDEEHLLKPKDFLDGAHIYYEEIPGAAGADPSFVINESDIPSAEVMTYYIKEAWYFDRNNSVFDVKTLAICPLVTMSGDLGERETTPLFWLPYENIRPYISQSRIMTSNINNVKTFTLDDYFRRRMFEGEIIKTENLMNKTLREYYPDPDSLTLAQKTIEKQLDDFRQSLYLNIDSLIASDPKATKKAGKEVKTSSRGSSASSSKQSAPKASPPPKAERSAPVRSVRRSR
ncbi:MAG: gliding motility protein GldN [Tannerellaceae bacterium]|jgi:gliding motility associated protien GldN|nr:gliding motility protein GldN [Tannerellaceae bacterium]